VKTENIICARHVRVKKEGNQIKASSIMHLNIEPFSDKLQHGGFATRLSKVHHEQNLNQKCFFLLAW